ncbi:MAG: hypothetical protein Q8J60_03195 [Thiobacillus sp.]|nr:hypothetical protein [Thiobacillus sp.]
MGLRPPWPRAFSSLACAKKFDASPRAVTGAALGLLFGTLLKIALAFTMVGVFVLDRLL